MSEFDITDKVSLEDGFVEATDKLVFGNRRLVRLLPLPVPGLKEPILRPAIWISPYTFLDTDLRVQCRRAIILMNKGSQGMPPDTVCMTIPADAIERFPKGPVEW